MSVNMLNDQGFWQRVGGSRKNPTEITAVVRKIVEEHPVPRDGRILDLACGDGELSIELASQAHAHVDAIDSNPKAIREAQNNLQQKPVDVKFEEAEVLAYLQKQNHASFDLITATYTSLIGYDEGRSDHKIIEAAMACLKNDGAMIIDNISRGLVQSLWEAKAPSTYCEVVHWDEASGIADFWFPGANPDKAAPEGRSRVLIHNRKSMQSLALTLKLRATFDDINGNQRLFTVLRKQ